MKKLLLIMSFVTLLFLTNIDAQSGNSGAPKVGVVHVEKCHSNVAGDTTTSFYQVYVYRVGKTDEQTLIGTFKEDGSLYTIPGVGSISLGYCGSGAGVIDSFDFTFDIVAMCDAGTNDFLRLYKEKCNNITNVCVTTVTDLTLSGGSYTVIGTVQPGSCNQVTYRDMAPDIYNITNTQSFAGDYYSISVNNDGTKTFTITTNAATFDVLPGGRYWCEAFFNEFTGKVEFCPNYTITGTSIDAKVVNVTRHSN